MAIQLVLHVLLASVFIQEASTKESSVALPGCKEKCGDVIIRHPFGIGRSCSIGPSFELYCNNTSNPPKPFFLSNNLEVLNISVPERTVQVYKPVLRDCTRGENGIHQELELPDGPFVYSGTQNLFIAMGCNNLALMKDGNKSNVGCMSFCNSTRRPNQDGCIGINCCQTRIPYYFSNFATISLKTIDPTPGQDFCKYAFIVDKNWFRNLTDIYSVQQMKQVPAQLDWYNGGAPKLYPCTNSSVYGRNTYCKNQSFSCLKGYEGTPYLLDGCNDINECLSGQHLCQENCINTPGGYNCSCNNGGKAFEKYKCKKRGKGKKARKVATIATCSGVGVVLVVATWWLCEETKPRKKLKLKKNFERNGGLLFRQQVSSSEGNVDTTNLFTSNELDIATDHYNKDRILGQGGQGTVYKGMLSDGRIVAVKKSRIEDDSKKEQFIKEVVLLSKINHRNIVKLHGCCLETEIPLLVYEFIPNGTLFEYIHDHNEDFPLTWDIRLRVAREIAGALFYLHSAGSFPIFHRDIKSSNILLDEKYRAKMADFGILKVHGTFEYLDPEYIRSSQFTDKSDVYSFGIVLVELLTGQKPILAPRAEDERRSLATHFILTMKEDRLFDILDPPIAEDLIAEEGRKEEITTFASIAYRCLNLNRRKRPTMEQVAAELESINMPGRLPTEEQHYEESEDPESEYPVTDHPNELCDLASTSMSSSTRKSVKVDLTRKIIKILMPEC